MAAEKAAMRFFKVVVEVQSRGRLAGDGSPHRVKRRERRFPEVAAKMAALHAVATSCDPPVAGVTRVHVRGGIGKRERIVYNFIRRTQCRPT